MALGMVLARRWRTPLVPTPCAQRHELHLLTSQSREIARHVGRRRDTAAYASPEGSAERSLDRRTELGMATRIARDHDHCPAVGEGCHPSLDPFKGGNVGDWRSSRRAVVPHDQAAGTRWTRHANRPWTCMEGSADMGNRGFLVKGEHCVAMPASHHEANPQGQLVLVTHRCTSHPCTGLFGWFLSSISMGPFAVEGKSGPGSRGSRLGKAWRFIDGGSLRLPWAHSFPRRSGEERTRRCHRGAAWGSGTVADSARDRRCAVASERTIKAPVDKISL